MARLTASATATRRNACAISSFTCRASACRRSKETERYYHADLIGLDVVTPDGTQIGTVHALHNFGAGDIIEIMPVGSGEPVMLPFTETTVPKIDLEAKQIVVVPPGRN